MFDDGTTDPSTSNTVLASETSRKNVTLNRASETIVDCATIFESDLSSKPVTISEIDVFDNAGTLLWWSVTDSFEESNLSFDAAAIFQIVGARRRSEIDRLTWGGMNIPVVITNFDARESADEPKSGVYRANMELTHISACVG